MNAGLITNLPLHEYLTDLGRLSGSVLSWVDSEPERFDRWRRGVDVDRQSAAMGRGSYVHAKLLEPWTISERFGFYPNRNEATEPVMREEIGPRGGKKMVPSGEFAPQDPSPAGARLSMKTQSNHAKACERAWLDANKGRTIVYPEDQPLSEAMVRAVKRHPEAAALLAVDDDFAPEVTGHWTCPETGEPLRIRPDLLRLRARRWVEIKTVECRGDERLNTLDPAFVGRAIRDGWARKSAMVHDGLLAITGKPFAGTWIVIEAREDDPRVSVVHDDMEAVGSFYTIGRDGVRDRDGRSIVRGYLELIRMAQAMREENDYRHDCVREPVPAWSLPGWMLGAMEADEPAVQLTGARRVEQVAHG